MPTKPNTQDISYLCENELKMSTVNWYKQKGMPAKFGIQCSPKPLMSGKEMIEIIFKYFIDKNF